MIESHLWQLQGDKTVTNPVNMGIVAVFLVDHYLTESSKSPASIA